MFLAHTMLILECPKLLTCGSTHELQCLDIPFLLPADSCVECGIGC